MPYQHAFSAEALRKLKNKDFFMATNLREVLDYDATVSHALPEDLRVLLSTKVQKALRERNKSRSSSHTALTLRLDYLRYSLRAAFATGHKKERYQEKQAMTRARLHKHH